MAKFFHIKKKTIVGGFLFLALFFPGIWIASQYFPSSKEWVGDSLLCLDIFQANKAAFFEQGDDFFTNAYVSPDGHLILGTGYKNQPKLCIWEIRDKTKSQCFKLATTGIQSACFSPNGQFIATAHIDIHIWDISTKQAVNVFKINTLNSGHSYFVNSIVFSPDGRFIVAGGSDAVLRIWDIQSGQLVWNLSGHTAGITTVAYSPDGRYILSGDRQGVANLWNVESKSISKTFRGLLAITDVGFSPNSKHVVTAGIPGACMWDIETGEVICNFEIGRDGIVSSFTFSPDQKFVVMGTESGSVLLLNPVNGEKIGYLFNHPEMSITKVVFLPGTSKVIVSGYHNNSNSLKKEGFWEKFKRLWGQTVSFL